MQKDFSFEFEGQHHDAFVISEDPSAIPNFVLIHGGGTGSKERIYTYSEALAKNGVSMLSFDQSGAGSDAANIKKSSLKRRTEESAYAIANFASKDPLIVCGSSMGGEIAIRLTERFPVKTLILFCPAVYAEAAFSMPFGDGFTEVIRQPDSWRTSAALSLLEKFTGKLLVVIGEMDTVIPPDVIQALDDASAQTAEKEIFRIPGCPHRYQEWLAERPDMLKVVQDKVVAFSL